MNIHKVSKHTQKFICGTWSTFMSMTNQIRTIASGSGKAAQQPDPR